MTLPHATLLRPIGYQTGDCGYCKSEESGQRTTQSRASYYVIANTLLPEHYQVLMDRGWRRLPAAEFHPSRDQRQTLNRWNRFILGEKYIRDDAVLYPKSKESKKRANIFDLHRTIHESESTNIKAGLEADHNLQVILEPDEYTEEKFMLFSDYQQHVHHESADEITRQGFKRFLCSSPLHRSTASGKALGSYHQCYRLNGRLIAMSVLDLLPHAVSGVYFIYHRDVEPWSMGKLSALREAALAGEGGYDFYYMGYYIHGCAKMRYKGTYKQQYVLDHETLEWDPLNDEMRSLMERGTVVSMSAEKRKNIEQPATTVSWTLPNAVDAVASGRSLLDIGMPGVLSLTKLETSVDLAAVKVLLGHGRFHAISDLVAWEEGSELDSTSIKGIVAEYAACVGPSIAPEAIIDFSR
ncbi:hypothetical protein AMS68_002294 [Peltaster fructicola]|uniref:Arginyl-tRNA--protein transferase 1 n=1 Tax=Peltaster fructicola TaxID=286661 RepID=A0A6H0XPT9_9PEZI|nr:hypothetical protein AMS68_002294 [Peltaster fructicola]